MEQTRSARLRLITALKLSPAVLKLRLLDPVTTAHRATDKLPLWVETRAGAYTEKFQSHGSDP